MEEKKTEAILLTDDELKRFGPRVRQMGPWNSDGKLPGSTGIHNGAALTAYAIRRGIASAE